MFEGNYIPILGLKASEAMGLLKVQEENFESVSQISEFEEVFMSELESPQGVQHSNTNPNVKPVIMPSRRILIAIRPKLREELLRMVSLGVIDTIDEATPWVKW